MEIKFRAWDKRKKEFVTGFVIYENQVFRNTRDFEDFVPTTDLELILSTGLKDKSGKEIYFKDAVRYLDESNTEQIGVVEPYNDVIGGYIEAINGDDEGNQDLQLHPDYQSTIEIIGNIYEHKYLLEEK